LTISSGTIFSQIFELNCLAGLKLGASFCSRITKYRLSLEKKQSDQQPKQIFLTKLNGLRV
jgi:hypothetical protein